MGKPPQLLAYNNEENITDDLYYSQEPPERFQFIVSKVKDSKIVISL